LNNLKRIGQLLVQPVVVECENITLVVFNEITVVSYKKLIFDERAFVQRAVRNTLATELIELTLDTFYVLDKVIKQVAVQLKVNE
jgi:hypothetical protein